MRARLSRVAIRPTRSRGLTLLRRDSSRDATRRARSRGLTLLRPLPNRLVTCDRTNEKQRPDPYSASESIGDLRLEPNEKQRPDPTLFDPTLFNGAESRFDAREAEA